jgi:hypothetical protein
MAAKQSAAAAHGGGNEWQSAEHLGVAAAKWQQWRWRRGIFIGGAGVKAMTMAAPAATPGDIVKQRSRNIAQRTRRSAPVRRRRVASFDGGIRRRRHQAKQAA